MANPCLTRDQLKEAVEQLPPVRPIGSRHVVEVSSLEHQDTRVINGVVKNVKLERIEFELVEYTYMGSKPTPMWKFEGDIDLNEFDEKDTQLLQLFIEVSLGAKDVQITKHTPNRATVVALFRKRSE